MMLHMRSARLARWQILLLTVSGSLMWLSGGVWILLHYFGQVRGEFGTETNPLQPWLIRLHGLALIPTLIAVGGLFVVHIPMGWRSRKQRNTGVALLTLVSLLILSGYLLYYVGDDDVRAWTSLIHWTIGLGVPALFLWHYLSTRIIARRGR